MDVLICILCVYQMVGDLPDLVQLRQGVDRPLRAVVWCIFQNLCKKEKHNFWKNKGANKQVEQRC